MTIHELTFDELSKQLSDINLAIEELKEKQKQLIKARQEVCKHYHIKHSGGEVWWDYYSTPNNGRTPWIYTCQDCGLVGTTDNGWNNPIYKLLEKRYEEFHI